MPYVDRIGLAREVEIFVVEETSRGNLAFPTVAADLIVAAGNPSIGQQPAFEDSPEIVKSRDVLRRFQGITPAGSISIPMLANPGGSPGDKPMGAALLKSHFGVETVNGGVSVVYSQSLEKPSVSIWMRQGHTVLFGRGSVSTSVAPSITNSGGSLLTFTGSCMQMGWVGETMVDGDLTDVSVIPVKTEVVADKAGTFYTPGGRIQIGADDNTGAGYEVISADDDTFTIAETISASDEDVVKPFLPTFTPIGEPLANKNTIVKFDGTPATIQALSITYNDPVTFLENEITPAGYPEKYVEGVRDISGSLDVTFMGRDVGYFHNGLSGTITKDIVVTVGTTPGMIFEQSYPKTQIEVPTISPDGDALKLSIPVKALGSGTGENSTTWTFK